MVTSENEIWTGLINLVSSIDSVGIRHLGKKTSDYFESEGLWLLPSFKKRKPKMHITLGLLVLAAKTGVWNTETLQQACGRKQYG